MTKMIKMSLIAAVAVTGMSSVAAAAPLEDAIKNTDLSGYIRYRYDNGESIAENNEYRMSITSKTKVNDTVSASVGLSVKGSTTNDSGDAGVPVNVSTAFFTAKLGDATVMAGKQGLATPFADASDQKGTGVVALMPVAGITLAGGWYTNTGAVSMYDETIATVDGDLGTGTIKGNNITALAAIGKANVVNFAAWYAKVSEAPLAGKDSQDRKAGATAMNLNLSAEVSGVNLEMNHASVDYSLNAASKATAGLDELNPTQTRFVASTNVANISLAAGYVMTGDEGGDVTLGDTDAASNFALEQISASYLADASIMYVSAGTKVAGIDLKLEYLDGDGKEMDVTDKENKATWTKADVSELKLSAAYAMSKNFVVSAFITNSEYAEKTPGAKAESLDMSRLEIKYTF